MASFHSVLHPASMCTSANLRVPDETTDAAEEIAMKSVNASRLKPLRLKFASNPWK
jgi:hypothetical protein